jgi:hypothetical protein
MSDTVDNVLNSVSEADEPAEVVVEETPVEEEAPVEETPVEEEAPVEEPTPVEEPEPEPVSETTEPEPVSETTEPEPVSTQEVVQNVQEILSSTETNVTVDNSDLEERVKVLEERLEKLLNVLHSSEKLWAYFSMESIYDNLPR